MDLGVGINVDRQYSTVLKQKDNPLVELIRANREIFIGIDNNKRSLENSAITRRRRLLKMVKPNKDDVYADLTRLCLPDMFKNYDNG